MALNNVGDIQNEILVRSNMSTTDSFITDAMLNDWTEAAHLWAAGYRKWPFTEGRINTTYVADAALEVGFSYPEGWKADSIRLLQVGGKRFKKVNFYKYQEFRENFPDDQKKIFSDHGLLYFINPNADVSGTTTVWGQYSPLLDATNKTATTVFSTNAEDGNDAVVEKGISYVKKRQDLLNDAITHEKLAIEKLEEIWKGVQDEQFGYQVFDDDGMFERFSVIGGEFRDDLRRDRWY